MAEQANERLRALKASIKEALGKLTGSDELEAQGALERSGGKAKPSKRQRAPTAKREQSTSPPREAKASSRRRS